MRGALDVGRDLGGVDDPGRPPAVVAQLHPHNLVVQRHPTRLATVAEVLSLRGLGEPEALRVEACWAALAADEGAAVRAEEAPVGVDVHRLLRRRRLAAGSRRGRGLG